MAKQLWNIDPMHSEIMFKVKHMLITNVSGTFDIYTGSVKASEDDFSDMEFSFEAEVGSINTRNSQRDAHLKSSDFFDAATHPTLSFKSTSVQKKSRNLYEVTGEFNIRGTKQVRSLQVAYTGTGLDLYGQRKAGFEIEGVLNRSDFGLVWNATNEDGTLALGEEVKITISAQVILQAGA